MAGVFIQQGQMFCFVCRMFGVRCGEKKEDSWISVGVTGGSWKNSVKHIREHAITRYHMSSMVPFKSYLQGKPIDTLLDEQRAELHSRRQKEITSNREVLAHLLDIIRLLAKQNLAFRGHDESSSSVNRVTFWNWCIIRQSMTQYSNNSYIKLGKCYLFITGYSKSTDLCNG